jgi:hypothetical protein
MRKYIFQAHYAEVRRRPGSLPFLPVSLRDLGMPALLPGNKQRLQIRPHGSW